jgi:hypothetical protein
MPPIREIKISNITIRAIIRLVKIWLLSFFDQTVKIVHDTLDVVRCWCMAKKKHKKTPQINK